MTNKRVLRSIAVVLGLAFMSGYATTASAQSPVAVSCVAAGRPDATCNVLGGSKWNQAASSVSGATIAGGGETDFPNRVTGNYGTVAGGLGNLAGDTATVAGGIDNVANGFRSEIGGGNNNAAGGAYSAIGGGENNVSASYYTTVSGGNNNVATNKNATVGGGSGNSATWSFATVGGGTYNTSSGLDATIAGGLKNQAGGSYSAVAGGSSNAASGYDTAVGGGSGNTASGENSNVGGGLENQATGKYSAVSGGYENRAGGAEPDAVQYDAVGGGSHNTASGFYATVPGGAFNTAAGTYSLAAGRRATVQPGHDGTFLFADSNDFDFASSAANEFAVRATGGVRLVTGIDASGAAISGVTLPPGSGSWSNLSDRSVKSNIAAVDPNAVLAQLMTVPISTWSYKTQDPSIRHIGPMAQDFASFGVGEDDKHIDTVDENGIALVAIQGLYRMNTASDQKIKDQERQIANLESENQALQNQVAALAQSVADLKQNSNPATAPADSSPLVPANAIVMLGMCAIGWMFVGNRRNSG